MVNITGRLLILLATIVFFKTAVGQVLHKQEAFTHQDTLRGSLNPERTWWDVMYYNITVQPDYINKTIKGKNNITFKTIAAGKRMQIDMQEPMEITAITFKSLPLTFQREGNVYHVNFPAATEPGSTQQIDISFAGKPREAVRPPWDGGWIWKTDANGNPWMSVA